MKKRITRSCAGCTVCCTNTKRPPLTPGGKEYGLGESCPHICASGCSKYRTRPKYCREFKCVYAQSSITDENWSEADRPDKCGVLIWHVPTFNAGFRVVVETVKLTDNGRRLVEDFKPMTTHHVDV